jgi:predicted N-acetyltransferase YhbS
MAQRKWVPRAYRDGDQEGIYELLKIVYPNEQYDYDKWLRQWHWMYRENPVGDGYIWVADDNGRIVGHSAAIPIMMKIGGSLIRGRLASNAMTHPDYRRQGMYRILTKHKIDELVENGLRIAYDFGGKSPTYPIDAKYFEAFSVCTTRALVKPYNWRNTLQAKFTNPLLVTLGAIGGNLMQNVFYRAKKTPAAQGLSIVNTTQFDSRINDLWSRVFDQYQIIVVRNQDYLNWRYVSIPDITYTILVAENAGEICGYIVFRSVAKGELKIGVIFDFITESVTAGQCLVAKAVACLKQEKVDLVACSTVLNSSYLKSYRRNGFISVPFVGHGFVVLSTDTEITKEFLANFKNWYAQIGNSDFL